MKSTRGYALLSVVTILAALLVASVATIRMTRRELRGTADSVASRKAFYVAEAGVQRALACLSQDRATAASSTAYTFSASNQAVGEGVYSVSVVQDPLFSTDPTRKQITGVGTANGQQATVVAQALVQTAPASSTICFTDTGTCKLQSVIWINPLLPVNLFTGNIFSNNNAAIETAVGALIRAGNPSVGVRSRIDARNTFTDGLVTGIGAVGATLLSATGAELRTGVQYSPSGILGLDLLHLYGLHFANGVNGHGQVSPPTRRAFPKVDWESLRRDARITGGIVNAENVPSGSWDATSGTWIVGSLLAPAVDSDTIYYVEGNVHITSLQLLKGAKMTIAARGASVVEALSVVNVGLIPGSQQDIRIIAEDGNTIGLDLISYSPWTLQTVVNGLGAGVGTAAGIGLTGLSVATTNRLFAYSETGDVWAKTSTLPLLSTSRVSMVAKNNATLAFTGSIASGVYAYQ
jgi:hypothetical protein